MIVYVCINAVLLDVSTRCFSNLFGYFQRFVSHFSVNNAKEFIIQTKIKTISYINAARWSGRHEREVFLPAAAKNLYGGNRLPTSRWGLKSSRNDN